MKIHISAFFTACRRLLRRDRVVGALRALPARGAACVTRAVRAVQPDRLCDHRESGSPPPGLRGPCIRRPRWCAGVQVGRNRACGRAQPAFTVCVMAWRWHMLWHVSPFARRPAAPLVFGIAAVLLAFIPGIGGWAMGIALLSLLTGCVQLRSPKPGKPFALAGLALALAACLIALASLRSTRSHGTPDFSTRLLTVRNAYFTRNDDDSAWFCMELHNVSRKTVTGFRGEISLLDASGKHIHSERVEHLEPMLPGASLFLFTIYNSLSLGLVENVYRAGTRDELINAVYDLDDTPRDLLEVRVEHIHKRFDQARHPHKTEFVCIDISTE